MSTKRSQPAAARHRSTGTWTRHRSMHEVNPEKLSEATYSALKHQENAEDVHFSACCGCQRDRFTYSQYRQSVCILSHETAPHSHQDDPDVKHQTPMLQIIEIVSHTPLNRRVAA